MDLCRHISKGNCVSLCTHSKTRYVGYMYFCIVCMQMHLCLFKEKYENWDQTVFEGNVLLFLRSQKIFLKNKKKKPCKTRFACVTHRTNDKTFFVVVVALIVEFTGLSTGRKACWRPEKCLQCYVWTAAVNICVDAALSNSTWTFTCENVSDQSLSQWVMKTNRREWSNCLPAVHYSEIKPPFNKCQVRGK